MSERGIHGAPGPRAGRFLRRLAADPDLIEPDRWHCRSFAKFELQANLAVFCDLDFREIAALRVKDIGFDDHTIRVRSVMKRDGIVHHLGEGAAERRDVSLPTHIIDMFTTWLQRHRSGAEHQALLFSSPSAAALPQGRETASIPPQQGGRRGADPAPGIAGPQTGGRPSCGE